MPGEEYLLRPTMVLVRHSPVSKSSSRTAAIYYELRIYWMSTAESPWANLASDALTHWTRSSNAAAWQTWNFSRSEDRKKLCPHTNVTAWYPASISHYFYKQIYINKDAKQAPESVTLPQGLLFLNWSASELEHVYLICTLWPPFSRCTSSVLAFQRWECVFFSYAPSPPLLQHVRERHCSRPIACTWLPSAEIAEPELYGSTFRMDTSWLTCTGSVLAMELGPPDRKKHSTNRISCYHL